MNEPTIKFIDMSDESFFHSTSEPLEVPSRWVVDKDDTYYASGKIKTVKSLPSGQYNVAFDRQGGIFIVKKVKPNTDDLIEINEQSADVIKEVLSFVEKIPLFKEQGLIPKRGIMFYGEPGQGKTSACNLIANKIIENNGIIFSVSSLKQFQDLTDFMSCEFRPIEKDRLVIVIIEDLDVLAQEGTGILTNVIDGQFNISPVIFIATTNHIDELPDPLLRPSRFDWLIKMTNPTDEQIRQYLVNKKVEGEELETFVKAAKGMSMADVKELFICCKVLKNDVTSVVKRLKDNKDIASASIRKSAPTSTKKIGFN